jgi:hypothetical protein
MPTPVSAIVIATCDAPRLLDEQAQERRRSQREPGVERRDRERGLAQRLEPPPDNPAHHGIAVARRPPGERPGTGQVPPPQRRR